MLRSTFIGYTRTFGFYLQVAEEYCRRRSHQMVLDEVHEISKGYVGGASKLDERQRKVVTVFGRILRECYDWTSEDNAKAATEKLHRDYEIQVELESEWSDKLRQSLACCGISDPEVWENARTLLLDRSDKAAARRKFYADALRKGTSFGECEPLALERRFASAETGATGLLLNI